MLIKLRILDFGYDGCFSVDRLSRSCGLTVLWKSNSIVSVSHFSSNCIDIIISSSASYVWRLHMLETHILANFTYFIRCF